MKSDIFKLIESKDSLIDKCNLTDEQKREVKDFFKKHNSYESEIDWNRVRSKKNPLSYEDFKSVMDKSLSKGNKSVTNGLKGLVKNSDYMFLGDFKGGKLYQPLTYKGSVVLASNSVEPKVSSILPVWAVTDNTLNLTAFPFGKPLNYDELIKENKLADYYTVYPNAKWCISMHTSNEHWVDYSFDTMDKFIFYFNDGFTETKLKKIAIAIDNNGSIDCVYNAFDEEIERIGNSKLFAEYIIPIVNEYGFDLEEIDYKMKGNSLSAEKTYMSLFFVEDTEDFKDLYIGEFSSDEDMIDYLIDNNLIDRLTYDLGEYFFYEEYGEYLRENLTDKEKEDFSRDIENDDMFGLAYDYIESKYGKLENIPKKQLKMFIDKESLAIKVMEVKIVSKFGYYFWIFEV